MSDETFATIKFYNGAYGFAQPDDGSADVYFGPYSVEGGAALDSGDRVQLFGLVENRQRPGRLRAKTVKLVERA
jgi:cold shock CspA family protein